MSAAAQTVARERCPACGDGGAEPFAELLGVPVQPNALFDTRTEALAAPRGDLVLAFCAACGLIWNVAFDPDALEYDAGYENSLHFSPTFQRYAEELADRLVTDHGVREKTVVEIGSGKGEFLALVCEKGGNRGVGFDPSYDGESDHAADGDVEFVRALYTVESAPPDADLVVCRHVLEHVENPAEFLTSVREAATHPGTVLYFELPAAEYMLRAKAVWDLIYPHVSVFSEAALRALFERCGFKVLRSGFSFGGQYLWIEASPTTSRARASRDRAALLPLADSFAATLESERRSWARSLALEGPESVAVWGAGAKGVTFLNVVEGGDRIGTVVDVNPRKHGKHMPGTGQRIQAPEELVHRPPSRVLVMNRIYLEEIEAALAALGVHATAETV